MPGTGNALAFGSGWTCGATAGAVAGSAVGVAPPCPAGAPGAPGRLTAGLIDALGGTGALPCWISVALCATEGGSAGVAAPGAATEIGPLAPNRALAESGTGGLPGGGGGGGGRLITVLITRVLWMLAKMMLFGGGAT